MYPHSENSPNDGFFHFIIHERGISRSGKLYMITVNGELQSHRVQVHAVTSPPGWQHLAERMICVHTRRLLRESVESEHSDHFVSGVMCVFVGGAWICEVWREQQIMCACIWVRERELMLFFFMSYALLVGFSLSQSVMIYSSYHNWPWLVQP